MLEFMFDIYIIIIVNICNQFNNRVLKMLEALFIELHTVAAIMDSFQN